MVKVSFNITDSNRHEFPVMMSRVPIKGELVVLNNSMYRVSDVVHTPDSNQDAVLVVSQEVVNQPND